MSDDGGVDLSSPASPRRSYRSLFRSASPVAEVVDEDAGEGGGGGGGSGLAIAEHVRGAATGFYGATRDLRQVCELLLDVRVLVYRVCGLIGGGGTLRFRKMQSTYI